MKISIQIARLIRALAIKIERVHLPKSKTAKEIFAWEIAYALTIIGVWVIIYLQHRYY